MPSGTEQLGPRSQIHDHDSHSETGSDLRTLRAAYRNRTDDLRITSVFPCVARGFKACASFMFAGCCWWRSLVVDGCSGASRGHARNAWAKCSMPRRCRARPLPYQGLPTRAVTCMIAGPPLVHVSVTDRGAPRETV